MAKFCRACGEQLDSSVKFCAICGTKTKLHDDSTEKIKDNGDIKKSKKRFKLSLKSIIGVLVVVMLLISGAYIILDYQKFRSFRQSNLFGSKDVYNQKQSLYFDDIKVTVSNVEHKEIVPKITLESCNTNNFKYLGYDGIFGNSEEIVDSNILAQSQTCMDAYYLRQDYKNIIVHYFIENLQKQPASIGSYTARIEGSNNIQGNNPYPKITDLLASQSRYSNFVLVVPMDADNLALVITKNGKQKQINLVLPVIEKAE